MVTMVKRKFTRLEDILKMKDYKKLYLDEKKKNRVLCNRVYDLKEKYQDIYSYLDQHSIVKLWKRCDLWKKDFKND